MKKSIHLFGLLLILVSCTQETAENLSPSSLEGKNLEELNIQKATYTQQINSLSLELEKVNAAISALGGGSEKRPLITAFKTQTQLFEHIIEVQANIKTRQNVLLYPEFAGALVKIICK